MNPLSVDWGSFLKLVLGIGSFLGQQKASEWHALRPWQGIGSGAYIRYENATDTTQQVVFVAPGFDLTRRAQSVAPRTEAFLKSPYTDCRVFVIIGRDTTRLRIERPGIYPLNKDTWQ